MTWARLMHRTLEHICNALELRLPSKSKPYPGNTGLEDQRARWTNRWLKGQSQRVAVSATKSWLEARKYLCPQRSLLTKYCSNISINDAAGGAECTLSKSADDTSRRRGWHTGWLCCHPTGLWQADEMGWQEPHQFNKDKYQILGRNNHMHPSILRSTTWKAALQGRTW